MDSGLDPAATANARLLAAAPCLLAALRTIAAGMGNLSLAMMGDAGVGGINDGKMRAVYLETFVKVARDALGGIGEVVRDATGREVQQAAVGAAIAKAEGTP
jgi:hypothetical protein